MEKSMGIAGKVILVLGTLNVFVNWWYALNSGVGREPNGEWLLCFIVFILTHRKK